MRLILKNIQNFKLKQDLLWVGVSTLATAIIWITYSVYIAFTNTTIDEEAQHLLTPFNPSLDKEALASLDDTYNPPENYTILVKQEIGDTSRIVPLGTNTPITEDDLVASGSATLP